MVLRRGFYPLQGPLDDPVDRPGLLPRHLNFSLNSSRMTSSVTGWGGNSSISGGQSPYYATSTTIASSGAQRLASGFEKRDPTPIRPQSAPPTRRRATASIDESAASSDVVAAAAAAPAAQPRGGSLSGSLGANRTWRTQYRAMKLVDLSAIQPQKPLMVLTGKVDYKQLLGEQNALTTQAQESDVRYRQMLLDFDRMKGRIRDHFSTLFAAAVARQQQESKLFAAAYRDAAAEADGGDVNNGSGDEAAIKPTSDSRTSTSSASAQYPPT